MTLTTAPTAMTGSGDKPYPAHWDDVADIKVFRATHAEWEKLPAWSAEMKKRGWRLLRVTSEGSQIVAVYGKSRRPADDR
jgi:hypothetical protein